MLRKTSLPLDQKNWEISSSVCVKSNESQMVMLEGMFHWMAAPFDQSSILWFYGEPGFLATADFGVECSSLSGACLADISWAALSFRLCLLLKISRWRWRGGWPVHQKFCCCLKGKNIRRRENKTPSVIPLFVQKTTGHERRSLIS